MLGAYLAPTHNFRLIAQGRFDDEELSLRRQNVYAHLVMGAAVLQSQYSYRRDDPDIGVFKSEQEILAGAGAAAHG